MSLKLKFILAACIMQNDTQKQNIIVHTSKIHITKKKQKLKDREGFKFVAHLQNTAHNHHQLTLSFLFRFLLYYCYYLP